MPWFRRALPYSLLIALATPAGAAPLDARLAVGAMAGLEVLDAALPPNATFLREDGTVGALSDFMGRVVVLNVWATWCAPCREEMPSLQALDDAMRGEGVAVVTLAHGPHALPAMRAFWDAAGVTSLPLHRDPEAALARALGVEGLPHTVLIGRDGRIAGRVVGPADWSAPEAIAVLRRLSE